MNRADLKKYPPYDVASLENSMKQCDTNIARFEEAIVAEQEKKMELRLYHGQCKERDALLVQIQNEEALAEKKSKE